MSSIAERIQAGTNARAEIRWPGTDVPVWIRVLSKADLQEAVFAADKRFRAAGIPVEPHTEMAYASEETLQILYRALSDEQGNRIVTSMELFRSLVSADVEIKLSQDYRAHEADVSPALERLSDEEFNALVENLRKNAEATIGCVSSIATARRLLRSLVAQLHS